MKKFAFIVALSLLLIPDACAKEGGDQYPNGAESWFAGAAPPRGLYYINYFGYYTGELKDGSGQKAVVNGTTPSVDATFDAFRFVEMTPFKILGADYGMHVIVPVVYQSMNLNGRNEQFQHRRHHHRSLHPGLAPAGVARGGGDGHQPAHRTL